jgi:hypothetical protein
MCKPSQGDLSAEDCGGWDWAEAVHGARNSALAKAHMKDTIAASGRRRMPVFCTRRGRRQSIDLRGARARAAASAAA